jgi:hypothetical protein
MNRLKSKHFCIQRIFRILEEFKMADIKKEELQQAFRSLKFAIEKYRSIVGDDGENVSLHYGEDGRFWFDQARNMDSTLYSIWWELNYLQGEIVEEGYLLHNMAKRYCLNTNDDYYYTSGSTIEYFYFDERYPEDAGWQLSTMEHNGDDYYIVSLGKTVKPEGVKVRVRKEKWD